MPCITWNTWLLFLLLVLPVLLSAGCMREGRNQKHLIAATVPVALRSNDNGAQLRAPSFLRSSYEDCLSDIIERPLQKEDA